MNLQMNSKISSKYRSRLQIVRVISENWAKQNLYCVSCSSDYLSEEKTNTDVFDFFCDQCGAKYQLKSSRIFNPSKIPDAGYDSMISAIKKNDIPNLLIMHYSLNWSVRNLILIPYFFVSHSTIEKRKPLSPNARRAGWVGCNILLKAIAPEGKIYMVSDGNIVSFTEVRKEYDLVKPLSKLDSKIRGWTLDVLNIARSLRKKQFDLHDIYEYEDYFKKLYPENKNIRPKIRQRLQVLRDLGILQFEGEGNYRFLF